VGTAEAAVAAPDAEEAPPLWLRLAPGIFLLLWSGGFPVGKVGIGYAGPMTFLSVRYALVLVVLAPLLLALRPPLPRGDQLRHLLVVGVLVQGLYFGLGYAALSLGVSAGTAALIASLQPILTALLAPLLTGDRIERRAWVGLGLGFAGAAVVIVAKSGVGEATAFGIAAAIGALLAITAGTFYEKRFGIRQHPVPANLVQHGVALAAFLPIAWLTEGFALRPSLPLAASLAYLVVGNSLVAVGLLLAMVRRGAVARVTALFFLVPPMSALLAWALLGEEVPPVAWLGFALAALGVALAAGLLPRATTRRP
jgi:drug/metabolite transporter (DMT)-like permease